MRTLLAAALVLTAGVARADKPKPKADACKPTPGACCPDPTTPRVRVCYSTAIGGVYEARVKYPETLILVFEGERPLRTLDPPDDVYAVHSRGYSVSIAPIAELAKDANIQIFTAHQKFTVLLKPSREPDAQLHIRDPEKNARDAVIDQRVEEAVAAKRKELDDARQKIDQLASEKAEDVLLGEIARSGIEVRDVRGKAVRFQNMILRPINLARVGERRFLLFAVQNRSGKPYHLKAVHLFADDRELPTKARIARQELPGDIADEQEVSGVIPLPQIRSGARLRVTIEESDPQRNVSMTAEAP
jgi:hypothetical protein